MSSSFTNSYSSAKPDIDEDGWVESVRRSICEEENEEIGNIPVSIFTVPQVLLATNPESYIPQQVALGPFHHWRPEVYDMQRYKLAAARRSQKHMKVSFDRIVEIMKKDEMRIRACYHKHIDMSGDALIWMMAVDMAFLLEFLLVYSMKGEGLVLKKGNSSMSHLVDVSGKKLSHMTILRDLVMVENQIPLFLVRTMLDHQYRETNKSADETLKSMLMGLYHELSPFQEVDMPDVSLDDCDHLLDFLYHMTVPNNKKIHIEETNTETEYEGDETQYEGRVSNEDINQTDITEEGGDGADQEESSVKPSDLRRCTDFMRKVFTKSNAGLIKILKMIMFGKFMAVLVKLPWKIITALPILNLLKEPIEEMLENFRGERGNKSKDDGDDSKAPLTKKITISSVMEMAKAGILFSPVNGGISEISFNDKTSTLYLPVIKLDVNTEVYLRNLVAYEAYVAAGPLVVARYTELMNGIIDTEEDAKYLSEKGIVLNHLKNDKEVADLWNGMSKSMKLTNEPKMDKVIEDVNKRYGKTWRVKLSKFMQTYVFESWRILALLATLSMLFLSFVEAFCSVQSCTSIFPQIKTRGNVGQMGGLRGVPWGVPPGVPMGVPPKVPARVPPKVPGGVPGVPGGVPPTPKNFDGYVPPSVDFRVPGGVPPGVPGRVPPEVPEGVPPGFPRSVPPPPRNCDGCVSPCVDFRVPPGVPPRVPRGVPPAPRNVDGSVPPSVDFRVPGGVPPGVPEGVPPGVRRGVPPAPRNSDGCVPPSVNFR